MKLLLVLSFSLQKRAGESSLNWVMRSPKQGYLTSAIELTLLAVSLFQAPAKGASARPLPERRGLWHLLPSLPSRGAPFSGNSPPRNSGRTLLGPLFGPSLRPSQGTWGRVTQGTQLVAPPMSFPPPYGKGLSWGGFIRLPHLKAFHSHGDFPQYIATCKFRGEYLPCPLYAASQDARTRSVFPPCDSRRAIPGTVFWRERSGSMAARRRGTRSGGARGSVLIGGGECWGAGGLKGNRALCSSPSPSVAPWPALGCQASLGAKLFKFRFPELFGLQNCV